MSTSITIINNNNCWDAFLFHLSRIRMWRLREIAITETEANHLLRAKVSNHLMQKYMGWRHSLLICALPFIFLSSLSGILGLLYTEGWDEFTGLGKLGIFLELTSPAVFFVALCFSVNHWCNVVKSTNICAYGWLYSLIAPIWPALFPIEFIVTSEELREMEEASANGGIVPDIQATKFAFGIIYTLHILPLVLTIPSGALKGSLRVRGLLPECSLAGWLIVIIAPITPLIIFASVVFMLQMFGNEVFVAGVVLLIISPMLYVFRRRLYTEALTEEQDRSLDWNQRIMAIMSITGVLLIGGWASKADYFPNAVDAIFFLLQWVGRALTSTLFFVDTVFRMTIHQLQVDRKRQEDGHYAEVDLLLASLPTNFDENEFNTDEKVNKGPAIDRSDDDEDDLKKAQSTVYVEPKKDAILDETESSGFCHEQ